MSTLQSAHGAASSSTNAGARWIHFFNEPLPESIGDPARLLGGKGASLFRMTQAGLDVPPGFTISTAACRKYFEQGRAWPQGLESELRRALSQLEDSTARRFGHGAQPLLVSVRSGAARSMPGMMDTLLNCGLWPGLAEDVGDTLEFWELYLQWVRSFARIVHGIAPEELTQSTSGGPPSRELAQEYQRVCERLAGSPLPAAPWDALTASVSAVFDSWNSERAIAYRRHHGLGDLDGTAVNVQMMFPSEISGVAFTRDPTLMQPDRIVIEAAYGLGETVVSGEVTPDRFIVERDDITKIDATPGHKAAAVFALTAGSDRLKPATDPDALSLTPPQVQELARLALRVEEFFGHAVDIEWGYSGGRFALLQARAIRGLDAARDVEIARQEEIHRLRVLGGGKRRLWITHNLAETLATPTPLTWDIVRNFMRGDGGFGRMYQEFGYRPARQVRDEGFLELICGRIYADPVRLAQMFFDGLPLRYDLDELAADRSQLDRAPAHFDADQADARFLATLPANLWAMWSIGRRMKRSRGDARERFEQQILPPYLDYVKSQRARDLSKLSDAELLAELHARIDRVLQQFGPESLRPGYFGGLALGRSEKMLTLIAGPSQGPALVSELTRALEGDTTFEQDSLLFDVASGRASMTTFLEFFGHRAIGEMELSQPRWREAPQYLETIIARWKSTKTRSPVELHQENLTRRRAAEAHLPETLARWGASCLREDVERDLAEARSLLPYRESGKHYLMMGYELIRDCLEALARRWQLERDIYFLRLEELSQFASPRDAATWPQERAALVEVIGQRRTRWQALARLDLPEVIDSEQLDELGLARKVIATDELTGTAIAAGVATGRARIIFDPMQAGNIEAGDILVCPSTDPGWTPLFVSVAALVIERGGVLSHGAIVARDFGIPAVACPQATRLLREGDRIRVDGNHGRVQVLSRENGHA